MQAWCVRTEKVVRHGPKLKSDALDRVETLGDLLVLEEGRVGDLVGSPDTLIGRVGDQRCGPDASVGGVGDQRAVERSVLLVSVRKQEKESVRRKEGEGGGD